MINSPIDEIKNRLDIVEVIGSYIKLQKAGANYRGLCPFHSEKKPSFFVSPSRQIWHCFGCSSGGSIFDFVMKIEGVEFGDALRILAQKAGVELKREDPRINTERKAAYEICEKTCSFFEKQLESGGGKKAKQYLLGRKISLNSIGEWRLGYAPDALRSLFDFLKGRGYSSQQIEKAGLVIQSERGDFYDRFQGRIIFPIFDLNGQVVGFGGRIFAEHPAGRQDQIAKYMNTPNTLIYDKSKVLYGLDKAKVEIRKRNGLVLMEGYTDVIMAHQAGFKNVISTSGTALTPFQLKILKRYSDNLFTAFDMDLAGNRATERGIDLAQSEDFNIKVVIMPQDADPCDVISENPNRWEKLLQEAKSILDFYFEGAFSRIDSKSPEGKKQISKILLPKIKRIPNKIEQSHWIQELSRRLEVKEEAIEEEFRKSPLSREPFLEGRLSSDSESPPESPPLSRKEKLEERIIGLTLKNPHFLSLIGEDHFSAFSEKTKKILENFKLNPNPTILINHFKNEDPQLSYYLNYLSLKNEVELESDSDPEEEMKVCLREIYHSQLKEDREKVSQEIKKAEEGGDSKKVKALTQKYNQIPSQTSE